MKKKLLYFLMLLGFAGLTNVNAKEIAADDIEPRTYIIGTHEFTESTTLSTKHIMLASKTIDGNTLNDMVIYYKNPRGKWINGLTGEIVEVSEKFNIEYVDLVKFLTTPTLANDYNDKTKANLSILGAGYYGSSEETLKEISGWELYEKTADGYTKITEGTNYTYEVALTPGETKTFVARVYKLNEALDRVYSDYSNEVEVTRDKLNTPTLANDYGDESKANLSILGAGYYGSSEETLKEISGWELYEKTENGYALLYAGANYNYEMTLEPGDSKTLVARVYAETSNGIKVYSDYSDEIVLFGRILSAPTLTNDPSDLSGAHLTMLVEGYYASGSDALKEISGWELYEKTENGYALLHDETSYTFNVSMEQGTSKIFISRVYFNKADGTKVYSEYSNEVVVTIEKLKVPTLSYDEITSTLTITSDGTYKDETELNKITGWELYEVGENLNLLLTSEKPYSYTVSIPFGMSKEFIARIYVIDVYDNKVYSEYSNQLSVEGNLIGDADESGEIDITDATIIKRYVHGLNVDNINLKNADVNNDGEVNEVDANIIKKYIAYKEDPEKAFTLPYNSGETYTISYDLDGGTEDNNQLTYAEISLPLSLETPTKEGYEFVGWTGSNGDIPELSVKITTGTTGNLNYKANWNLKN